MPGFEFRDLTFTYPGQDVPALRNINLKIEQGEFITVCGKSGSGKTTLLKHLKSVLTPAGKRTGEVLMDGLPLSDTGLREQASAVGYVMQSTEDQIVTDKVWHELAFGLENLGADQKTIRLRVAEMASYFGIQNWFMRDTSELSGGQKQLLNLASVMAMQPQVLILDEPTSQLDPIAASDFINTVRKINQELGTTVIITEHRLEDIYPYSDRVIVLEAGSVICDGRPGEVAERLYTDKNDIFTAIPAPARIYYGSDLEEGNCPMTVREGRRWLSLLREEGRISEGGMEGASEGAEGDRPSEGRNEAAGAETVLSLKNVWFRYEKNGSDILKGVDLDVKKGQLFAIVGGNGTGKTTMLKCICRICRPYRGNISINGRKLASYRSEELFHSCLSMLPQDQQSLFAKPTVREDLEEMLGARRAAELEKRLETEGFDAVPLDEEVKRVAEICEITHLLARNPYDLSGGEQQRAALGKVLMTHPRLLLLDEPTKGMDNLFKEKFAGTLKKLTDEGMTVVMVSHDVEFCAKYADRVGMFFDGAVLTSAAPKDFFSRNSFYTTAANRMARHIFPDAVTTDDVIGYLRDGR